MEHDQYQPKTEFKSPEQSPPAEMPYRERAERLAESDPELASDLRFTAALAEAAAQNDATALVVGGRVRDTQLQRLTGKDLQSKDIDVEVYSMGADQLMQLCRSLGKIHIDGRQFAVLKVRNHETGHDIDVSIPRRDSKVAPGHTGFVITGDPTMSVQEAASRRDFTFNAMAENPLTGELHDYFGGRADLQAGIIRATDARYFADDPLRVMRAMQFAGRFQFDVDPATAELCRGVDLTELPKERVGEEWDKLLLRSERPSIGLEVAKDLGILRQLHPQLEVLSSINQEPEWHPDGNVWEHTKLVADAAARVIRDECLVGEEAKIVAYAALCHDLGKAATTMLEERRGQMRITARAHDQAGVALAESFLESVDKAHLRPSVLPLVREHMFYLSGPIPGDAAIRRFARRLHPATIRQYDLVSRCDSNGRGQEWEDATPSSRVLDKARELDVAEAPMQTLIQGRHVEAEGIEKGIVMGRVVAILEEAQEEGKFTEFDGGMQYFRDNRESICAEAQRRADDYVARMVAAKEARRQAAIAASRKLKQSLANTGHSPESESPAAD